ncbi:MAG: hypothetical protein AAF401_11310 [Pseudomonadota bacterium]
MTDNVAAPAPAVEEASPAAPITEAAEAPKMSLDEELDAIFDKAEAGEEDAPEADGAEEEAPEAEADAEKTEEESAPPPTDIPKAVAEHWKDIPEGAQTAIVEAQRKMVQNNATLGRELAGLKPIRETLDRAVAELPAMQDKTPEQVAKEVFELSRFASAFTTDPRGTLLKLAAHHKVDLGLAPQGGDAPQAAPAGSELETARAELSAVRQELAAVREAVDPQNIQNMITSSAAEERSLAEVTEFSAKAEHWNTVEPHMGAAIMFIQQANAAKGVQASTTDVLDAAYQLAVREHVGAEAHKAKAETPPKQATSAPTPEKAKAAKDINVSGRETRGRPQSLDEALDGIYDRHHK